ncbi:SixA phosphatase family protein [Nonomuraea maritima]|uniref:SixA phosphatase family protein n=1 Tax=Nonomuraea maritima TaxID=683260 RepID=UPI0037169B26
MRTLIVLRHAKAAHVAGLADRERPLTHRGERDAQQVGQELRAAGLDPDVVLCSPAVRTRRTAQLAFPGKDISYERDIYEAYADELLEIVRRCEPDARTVVLCGHNPGVHELAVGLAGGDYAFHPGAFAVIEVNTPWEELTSGEGRLTAHWDPKEH